MQLQRSPIRPIYVFDWGFLSQRQCVFDKPPHGCAYRRAQRVSDLKGDFVKVGLDVLEAGVKHVVHFGLGWHFWQVFVAVDDLNDVDHLLTKLLPHFLPTDLPLLLIGQVDNVHLYAPHLPGNALVRKWPAGLFLLVELQ